MSSQDQWTPWAPDQTLLQQVRVKHRGVRRHALQSLPGKIQTVPNASSVCGSYESSIEVMMVMFRRYSKIQEHHENHTKNTGSGATCISCIWWSHDLQFFWICQLRMAWSVCADPLWQRRSQPLQTPHRLQKGLACSDCPKSGRLITTPTLSCNKRWGYPNVMQTCTCRSGCLQFTSQKSAFP